MPAANTKVRATRKSKKTTIPAEAINQVDNVVAVPTIKPGSMGRRKLTIPKLVHEPVGRTQEILPVSNANILVYTDTFAFDAITIKPFPDHIVETVAEPVIEITTTFNIDEFRNLINRTLANSTCSTEMRKGMIVALETVLRQSGRFNGTRPLTIHEVPLGQRPGVNIDPVSGNVLEHYAARDIGTDKTRIEYL